MIALLAIAFTGIFIGVSISEIFFLYSGARKYPAMSTKGNLLLMFLIASISVLIVVSYHSGDLAGYDRASKSHSEETQNLARLAREIGDHRVCGACLNYEMVCGEYEKLHDCSSLAPSLIEE